MAAVVNVLSFKDPVDPAVFAAAERDMGDAMRAIEGFEGFEVVHTGAEEVVLIIRADTPETLDRIATEVGSPWMVEHVVPLLAGPPARRLGPTIASV